MGQLQDLRPPLRSGLCKDSNACTPMRTAMGREPPTKEDVAFLLRALHEGLCPFCDRLVR
jgi:hypothetical protein